MPEVTVHIGRERKLPKEQYGNLVVTANASVKFSKDEAVTLSKGDIKEIVAVQTELEVTVSDALDRAIAEAPMKKPKKEKPKKKAGKSLVPKKGKSLLGLD